MLEKQQHEQDHGRMNAIKIHNQWRRIMRMAKTEELKQDIEILSQSFDRNVDRKDALIQVNSCQPISNARSTCAIYLAKCFYPLPTTIKQISRSRSRFGYQDVCVAQALDRDLEDAEEQYGTALRGHLQVIDSLQNMQYARMKTMQEQFQANLKVSCRATSISASGI